VGGMGVRGIGEGAPPRVGDVAMLPFWIAAATLVVLVIARGRRMLADAAALRDGHPTICLCALALLPPAVGAVRNVPPFLLIAVQAIAALARIAPEERREGTPSPRVNLAIAAAPGAASPASG